MSRAPGQGQQPAMTAVSQLQDQFTEYVKELRRQAILDDQFLQILKLQDECNPDFVVEVATLFFQDSDRLLDDMSAALGKRNVDYKQVDDNVHQLKGSSASLGAGRVKNLCVAFRSFCETQDFEACWRCLHQVKQECAVLKSRLNALLMLQQQILAAGGSIPSID